uniref:Uncharacterized protein n=1 Tax=Parascaris equorum TaxID=6256 RepID=A0A914RD57_PAREQ
MFLSTHRRAVYEEVVQFSFRRVLRSDEVYREMETRIRELEAVNNELRVSKSRIEGRVAELEQMLSAECSEAAYCHAAETFRSVALSLTQIPYRSASMHSSGSESTAAEIDVTAELSKELETLRESEATQRTRAQKAIQRLRDVEGEFDEEVKAVKEECAKENEGHEQARRERDTAAMLLQEKVDELQVKVRSHNVTNKFRIKSLNVWYWCPHIAFARKVKLQSVKAENAELRQSVAKLHKELEEFGSGSDMQNGEVGQLKRVKRQLEAKCAEQVII